MQTDALHRFVFEHTAIRGNTAQLSASFHQALEYRHYPALLRTILGEFLVASTLLAATLKMRGSLILQIKGTGSLKWLVVECNADLGVRATANWEGELPENLPEMLRDGQCVITLDQNNGEQYQGIVPLEGDSIAHILENYMLRSQQIETKLWLTCDGTSAAGMLLQKLPDTSEDDTETWHRIGLLADTVTAKEMQTLEAAVLLSRLFNEEDIRLFKSQKVTFYCPCTRQKVSNMLNLLGKSEIDEMLQEREEIEVNCDFCGKLYTFNATEAHAIFEQDNSISGTNTKH